ncbi:glycine cleavage system protein R [Thaumasiovibrio sp. DFM-14]|uniref:glycine cleavage system protein R n=1 Tax=Thaumasiovibrio sp. DFM-14 TaxID=3384792 RepID=UPI0039A05DA1
MDHYLVFTAMGQDRPGICDEVIQHISDAPCNIIDSRIGSFGDEFTLIMLISGSKLAITQIEQTLPRFAQQRALITLLKRTTPHQHTVTEYMADFTITLTDAPAIIAKFTHFLATRDIDLTTLRTNTTDCADGSKQLSINISSRLPDDCHLIELQEAFTALCLSLNAQGSVTFSQNNIQGSSA